MFFTIVVAVISYVKTKGDDRTTADGFFLAGRSLTGFVIAASLRLANQPAEQLVSMSPMAFEALAATAPPGIGA